MNTITLECLYQTSEEKDWFSNFLKDFENVTFQSYTQSISLPKWEAMKIILSFHSIKTNTPVLLVSKEKNQASLFKELVKIQASCFEAMIEALPFHLSVSNPNGLVLSNSKTREFSFFEEPLKKDYQIPQWIQSELKEHPAGLHHLDISSMTNAIPMHSYYFLEHEDTTLEIVADIKPQLSAYLKESAQALVPWSDTTSGASISSDIGDKLLEDY